MIEPGADKAMNKVDAVPVPLIKVKRKNKIPTAKDILDRLQVQKSLMGFGYLSPGDKLIERKNEQDIIAQAKIIVKEFEHKRCRERSNSRRLIKPKLIDSDSKKRRTGSLKCIQAHILALDEDDQTSFEITTEFKTPQVRCVICRTR
jgi:hypothetical protein